MSKNKLSWITALFLIIIFTLPIAYAQIIPAGTKIYFVLINAAIIFVLLFIVQSFLVKGKTEKETTSVWVIMILASLLLGYFFGQNGYLWQGPLKWIFNPFVLVNSAIIAGILYFVLGLLKIQNLQSTEGKTGYGILIFLFSVMIAINIAPDKFLWEEGFVRTAFAFLFSSERGILNPKSGLLVFVTSFILISFFFTQFLLKEGKQTLNYALALIFAVNLAMPPVNPIKDVVQMGEIIFILIVWNTLKTTVPQDKPWAAFLLSILLVGWASAALTINTPQNRGAVAGMICHTGFINCKELAGAATAPSSGFFGTARNTMLTILIGLTLFWMFSPAGKEVKKISGWTIGIGLVGLILLYMWGSGAGTIGKLGLGILLLMVLIGLMVFGISRAEGIWKFGEIKKRIGRNIVNMIRIGWNKLLDKTKAGEMIWVKRLLEPDRLPAILRENVVYLFSLSNYLKRMYIMYSKMAQVKKAEEVCNEMTKQIDRFTDVKKLEEEIYNIRNGGDVDGKLEVGWFEGNRRVITEIQNIIKFVRDYHNDILNGVIPKDRGRLDFYYNQASLRRDALSRAVSDVQTAVNVLLAPRAIAYSAHQPIKAWKYLVLDQCNPYGEYEHFYKFVDKGTELYEYDETTLTKEIVKAEDRLEVNLWGEVLKDKYKQLNSFFKPWKESKKTAPRRVVDPNKIYDLGTFVGPEKPAHIMTYIVRDWEGFIQDLRFGEYKYYSKGVMDYISRLGTASDDPRRLGRFEFFDEKNIKTTIDFKSSDNPAFDRRAHDSPGFIRYGGRIFYNDTLEEIKAADRVRNPYPAISSRGMSKYIPELIQKDVDDVTKARDYLSRFLRDTGETLTGPKDVSRGISSLGEEETTQKGGE